MKCPLIAPASNGDIEQIEKLLKNGQYMQKTDENGRTPLMFAVFFNHFETAEHLLERKICDINHQDHYGNTALMFAVNADYVDIVLLLQVYGADLYIRNKQEQHAYFIANRRRKASEAYISPPGTGSAKKYPDVTKKETMITWAVKAESIRLLKFVMRKQLFNTETLYETVRVLLSRPTSDLLSAILPILEVRAIINYFEEDSIHYRSTVDMRQTLFMHACASSRMENVQRLLENGADPTIIANANHAMLVAMKNKRMEVVTLILDHLQNDVSCYDDFFEYIFENDYSEVLTELVDRGISADYMYKSVPLIIWATTNRAKACLKVLLEKGANPNAGHPYTALAEVDFQPKKLSEIELKFRSSLNESVEIMKRFAEEKEFVELLVSYGADVHVKNQKEESILFLHLKKRNLDVVRVLLEHTTGSPISLDTVEALEFVRSLDTNYQVFEANKQLMYRLYFLKIISMDALNLYPINKVKKDYRITNCHGCGKGIDDLHGRICGRCKWILCECGSCGCNYVKR